MKSTPSGRRRASPLRVTRRAGVVSLWLRYRRGARIDYELARALCDVAEDVRTDDGVGLVVLRAEGADFCRGFAAGEWPLRVDCVAAIAALPQPVIAAVQGRAEAEGCELALACDLRIVDRRAHFAWSVAHEGRLPRHGATQRLPRLVGRARALDLLLTGRRVGAVEAVRIGLATRLAPANRLGSAVQNVTRALIGKGPLALRLAKEAVLGACDMTLAQGMRFEEDLYALLQTTDDRAEGVRAFREKRRPRFRGR